MPACSSYTLVKLRRGQEVVPCARCGAGDRRWRSEAAARKAARDAFLAAGGDPSEAPLPRPGRRGKKKP